MPMSRVMKVFVFHPTIDSRQEVLRRIESGGHQVILAQDPAQAWNTLASQGASIDLAWIHREGRASKDVPGLDLLSKLKKEAALVDLPVVLSSGVWGDPEFARHQDGSDGANGYLRFPFGFEELDALVRDILGMPLAGGARGPLPVPGGGALGVELESASGFFLEPSRIRDPKNASIRLELPEIPDAPEEGEPSLGPLSPVLGPVGVPSPSAASAPASPSTASPLVPPLVPPSSLPELSGFSLSQGAAEPEKTVITSVEAVFEPVSASGPPEIEISLPAADSAPDFSLGGVASVPDPPPHLGPPSAMAPPPPPAEREPFAPGSKTATSFSLDSFAPPEEGLRGASQEGSREGLRETTGNERGPEAGSRSGFGVRSAVYEPDSREVEAAMASEMPYLYNRDDRLASGSATAQGENVPSLLGAFPPLGDAVVPGGAADAPDFETMKKYLFLRERDVAVLSQQLKTARDRSEELDAKLRRERARAQELEHQVQDTGRKLAEKERRGSTLEEQLRAELEEARFQLKAKSDKARLLEASVREAQEEIGRLKERVRQDIRRIRVREKELENRLEILKKDSEVLISAREAKIVELKRRVDLLEFNGDLIQEKLNREQAAAAGLRERLGKAAQVVRVVSGLLDAKGAAQLNELAEGLSSDPAAGSALSAAVDDDGEGRST
jgi:hypothetical protein